MALENVVTHMERDGFFISVFILLEFTELVVSLALYPFSSLENLGQYNLKCSAATFTVSSASGPPVMHLFGLFTGSHISVFSTYYCFSTVV